MKSGSYRTIVVLDFVGRSRSFVEIIFVEKESLKIALFSSGLMADAEEMRHFVEDATLDRAAFDLFRM